MADPDLRGAVLDGRYQVIEAIAQGAMGAVYRGERLRLGRAVAIKIMHDALPSELSSRQRFEREAKLMARLEHPHCVSVIDFGLHDERPYLVMDLVRGTSLLELVARVRRVPPARAAELMRQMLSGLAHAHELGIIHRDIKPANIMLAEKTGLGEQVRLLDFGLARPVVDSTKLTTGIVVGTPNYMAPEQIKGGAIDARTDLYACGVVLFELVTGKKPFVSDDPLVVVRKHMNEPPPTLADAAPDAELALLEPIVAKALAKAPGDRYQTTQEMSEALELVYPHTSASRALSQAAVAAALAGGSSAPVAVPRASTEPPVTGPTQMRAPTDPGRVPRAVTGPPIPPPTPSQRAKTATNPGAKPPTNPGVAPAAAVASAAPLAAAPDAPSQPNAIPPTRAFARRYRVSPRQIALGAGAAGALLIVIVAIVHATRGSDAAPPAPLPAAKQLVAQPAPPPADPTPVAVSLTRAAELYADGDLGGALDVIVRARHQHADSAQLAFLEGKIYFAKLWWFDGIKAFRDAIRLDPAYRSDPEMVKLAVRAFLTTPSAEPQLSELLHADIGAPARTALEDVAKTNKNPRLRTRAEDELKLLPQALP